MKKVRKCRECGEKFVISHPGQYFCPPEPGEKISECQRHWKNVYQKLYQREYREKIISPMRKENTENGIE